jgi:predicted Rossmann-fold nucleotide-binding protein
MKNTKRYTVFCGSSAGNEAIYAEQATALGKALVQRNIGLVFGGGKIGMMGAVADAVMRLHMLTYPSSLLWIPCTSAR